MTCVMSGFFRPHVLKGNVTYLKVMMLYSNKIQPRSTYLCYILRFIFSVKSCPENCNGNGHCNTINGKCACNPNYRGHACSSTIFTTLTIHFFLIPFPLQKRSVIPNPTSSHQGNGPAP